MKVTVVPAQITTVEDRIAGNLGLSQLLLLVAPVFIACALYVLLPPNMHSSPYKVVVMATIAATCGLLAIRIKGKLLLLWLIVIVSYNVRPRYYLYNKNTLLHREQYRSSGLFEPDTPQTTPAIRQSQTIPLSPAEAIRVQRLLDNPAAHISYENNRKGGLYVRITEIKEQG